MMISYKRDVLERQSLSEVKMGRGSPICKRVRKKLCNTLKTTILNVRLQRLCKSHNLQIITSSKDSEKLEKSLCVRGEGWSPLLDARGLRTSNEIFSLLCKVLWVLRKALYKCNKLYVNMVQKCHRVLWPKAHLKWTVSKWSSVLWSDESKFDMHVGNRRHRVLRAKEEWGLPCYQHSVQNPASLMVWGA